MGEGLCGWVAEKRKPIINGNPEAEAGYVSDPAKFTTLRSILAVPLEGLNGVVGVLAMYRADRDAFSADHLRILLAVSSKIALSVENALKYQQAEDSATTDYLTGTAQRALVVRSSVARTGALPPHRHVARGDGLRPRQLQAD
jgi:GAF domain-containing protein